MFFNQTFSFSSSENTKYGVLLQAHQNGYTMVDVYRRYAHAHMQLESEKEFSHDRRSECRSLPAASCADTAHSLSSPKSYSSNLRNYSNQIQNLSLEGRSKLRKRRTTKWNLHLLVGGLHPFLFQRKVLSNACMKYRYKQTARSTSTWSYWYEV